MPGPKKFIRKAKQAALDQILLDTKKRAKKLEMKQIFSKFVDGLKIFYPQDYEEIMKEKQEKLARRKGVQPQELERK